MESFRVNPSRSLSCPQLGSDVNVSCPYQSIGDAAAWESLESAVINYISRVVLLFA